MADNVPITAGVGTDIRTDDIGGKHLQIMKIALGADGFEDNLVDAGQQLMAASLPVVLASDQSAVPVSGTIAAVTSITNAVSLAASETHIGEASPGKIVTITVTPTLTVHATYVAGDYVGTSGVAAVIANAARIANGSGYIAGVTVIDKAMQGIAGEIHLFDTAVTPPNDSAAWTITDADAASGIGVIPVQDYYASAANTEGAGYLPNGPILFSCIGGGTSLYFCFVTRGAPAYADGDLVFRFKIVQY